MLKCVALKFNAITWILNHRSQHKHTLCVCVWVIIGVNVNKRKEWKKKKRIAPIYTWHATCQFANNLHAMSKWKWIRKCQNVSSPHTRYDTIRFVIEHPNACVYVEGAKSNENVRIKTDDIFRAEVNTYLTYFNERVIYLLPPAIISVISMCVFFCLSWNSIQLTIQRRTTATVTEKRAQPKSIK